MEVAFVALKKGRLAHPPAAVIPACFRPFSSFLI
jgi:hypothetical protein